jgi:hypothetical protein
MFHQSVHGIQNKVYPDQITEDAVYFNRADKLPYFYPAILMD